MSLNHPLAAILWKQGERMRKLQYLFMTLSVLFMAVPALRSNIGQ